MNQLTLGISLRDDATFANFLAGRNLTLVNFLQEISSHKLDSKEEDILPKVADSINDNMVYLWGSTGSGLSHLLQACCHYLTEHGQTCLYLPLKQASDLSPQILEGLDKINLIAIDDVDAIAGLRNWEEQLFHFYNSILHLENTYVIFAAHNAAKQIPFILPDLQSRLSNLVSLHVQTLEDYEKLAVLQMRAKARGLEITKRVGIFLLNRCSRNMASLFQILEKLDQASLVAQRKLTIPFVKGVLRI